MADYWMKLYIEILDDPKMATLPDRIWRRVIELFLVAKRLNKDGWIPDTRQVAWMLRMNPDELEADIAQIVHTGIIERVVNGWFIPKFADRQAAVGDAERKAQERIRKQSQQYYGLVTDLSRSVTQKQKQSKTESETNTEADSPTPPPPPNVFQVYESEIGALTAIISDDLQMAERDYSPEWVIAAIQEAAKNNKRSWAYALAILKRCKAEGKSPGTKDKEKQGTNGNGRAPGTGPGRWLEDAGTGEKVWFPD